MYTYIQVFIHAQHSNMAPAPLKAHIYIYTSTRTQSACRKHTFRNQAWLLLPAKHIHTYIYSHVHAENTGNIPVEIRLDHCSRQSTYIHLYIHMYMLRIQVTYLSKSNLATAPLHSRNLPWVCIHMYIYIYTIVFLCMNFYTYTGGCIRMHIWMCAYVRIYIYIYIYIYIMCIIYIYI